MKNKKRKLSIIFITLFLLLVLIAAESYKKIAADNSEICLTCHEDRDLYMDKNGKKISIYVDATLYKNSVHGSSSCTDCHEGYNPDEMPHSKVKTEINCKNCHDNVKGIESSVHANKKCYECHTKHYIKPAKEYSKEQTATCIKCHTNKNVQQYKNSIHFTKDVGCEGCHQGGHNTIKINKQDVAVMCGKCHGQHQKNFNNSIHQVIFQTGSGKAPTCSDCHGSHQILTSKMSIESQSCLKCHLDEKKFPGEEKDKGSAKFVSRYKTSIHASIEKDGKEAAGCSDCHGNHNIQNPENPQASTTRTRLPETCGKCHPDIVQKYLKSAHGKALMNKSVTAPSCVSCHNEHSIEAVRKSDEFSKINQVELCLKCHIEGKLPHKNYKGEEVLISNYKESHHYIALKEGKLNAASCSDCHGSHEMAKFDDPNSRVYKKNMSKTCGQTNCHVKQFNEYLGSVHEVSLELKNNNDAPTCIDCHGRHQILKKDEQANRISNAKGLIQLCSDCHNSVEIVKRYNLPTGRTESYLESFHGLAIRGGSKIAANCESCHGYHNIRPSKDSLSTINKKNLPHTCGKCHPGANDALFNTPIHVTDEYVESPILYWVSKFYLFMIIGTIGIMVVHNIFDISKKFKKNKV
jgi:predicted CXXCH cytochrome family protein